MAEVKQVSRASAWWVTFTWPVAVYLVLSPVAGAFADLLDAGAEAVRAETERRGKITTYRVEVDPSISDAP